MKEILNNFLWIIIAWIFIVVFIIVFLYGLFGDD